MCGVSESDELVDLQQTGALLCVCRLVDRYNVVAVVDACSYSHKINQVPSVDFRILKVVEMYVVMRIFPL